jgi:hypothetical protein
VEVHSSEGLGVIPWPQLLKTLPVGRSVVQLDTYWPQGLGIEVASVDSHASTFLVLDSLPMCDTATGCAPDKPKYLSPPDVALG